MAGSKIKNQKSKIDIAKLQEEIKVLDNNWKRALADYQNLTKRFEGEKQEVIKLAGINVISKLLPILDILEMAAGHSQDEGVKMAVKQFQQVLKEEGLEEISPMAGDKFDHNLHECIETLNTNDSTESIAEVAFKGYKINGLILRPARVKVYKPQAEVST